jgi:hypothetical protein
MEDLSVERDSQEDALRDLARDAFMAFWRRRETADAEALWQAYCAAQARYEAYLMAGSRPAPVVDMDVSSLGRVEYDA